MRLPGVAAKRDFIVTRLIRNDAWPRCIRSFAFFERQFQNGPASVRLKSKSLFMSSVNPHSITNSLWHGTLAVNKKRARTRSGPKIGSRCRYGRDRSDAPARRSCATTTRVAKANSISQEAAYELASSSQDYFHATFVSPGLTLASRFRPATVTLKPVLSRLLRISNSARHLAATFTAIASPSPLPVPEAFPAR